MAFGSKAIDRRSIFHVLWSHLSNLNCGCHRLGKKANGRLLVSYSAFGQISSARPLLHESIGGFWSNIHQNLFVQFFKILSKFRWGAWFARLQLKKKSFSCLSGSSIFSETCYSSFLPVPSLLQIGPKFTFGSRFQILHPNSYLDPNFRFCTQIHIWIQISDFAPKLMQFTFGPKFTFAPKLVQFTFGPKFTFGSKFPILHPN
jgi:hypothetical protein